MPCRNWSSSWMILTDTTLPSAAETHGSQRPNVTVPFTSMAPRSLRGSSCRPIASQGSPLDVTEKEPPRVRLHSKVARILWRRRQAATGRLRITREVELVHHVPIQCDREVGPIDRDLVIVPLTNRARRGRRIRSLEAVNSAGAVDACVVGARELVDLDLKAEVHAHIGSV